MAGNVFGPPPPQPVPTLALRPRDLATALGVSEKTISRWRDSEQLPYVLVAGVVTHPVSAVRAWLHQRTQTKGKH
jgi:predicted DNA-binding transcriptional regulator AlpA